VVQIVGTSVSAAVTNGQFTLQGVPPGDQRLRFTGNGCDASVTVTGLKSGDSIQIKVTVSGTTATLDYDSRNNSGVAAGLYCRWAPWGPWTYPPGPEVPVVLNPGGTRLPASTMRSAVERALNVWTEDARVPVRLVLREITTQTAPLAGAEPSIRVYPHDAPGLAQTGVAMAAVGDDWAVRRIGVCYGADVWISPSAAWEVVGSSCGGGYDVETTLVHEFGHALGLLDNTTPGSTMAMHQSPCQVQRHLSASVIPLIQQLYPPATPMSLLVP
jgi:hypothetical protein